jgi:hypothetical protein
MDEDINTREEEHGNALCTSEMLLEAQSLPPTESRTSGDAVTGPPPELKLAISIALGLNDATTQYISEKYRTGWKCVEFDSRLTRRRFENDEIQSDEIQRRFECDDIHADSRVKRRAACAERARKILACA